MPDLIRLLRFWLLALVLAAPGAAMAQEAVSVSISNARLALIQFAIATGDSTATALMGASGDSPLNAIYLQAGIATLSQVAAELAGTETPDALTTQGKTTTAHLPIVVLPGAKLTIGEFETLVLDRAAGAFVLSLGQVSVTGATVESAGSSNSVIERFRPFLAGIGQQSLILNDSVFEGLGFGEGVYNAGISLSGRGLLSGGEAAPIVGNLFRDIRGVALSGLDKPWIENNTFTDSRGIPLALSGGEGGHVSRNLFRGTGGAYALHVSDTSGLKISDNTFDRGGKAVRIDDFARGILFAQNFATGFGGTAVTVAEDAGCVRLSHNVIADNDGGGVLAQDVGTLVLDGNVLADNRGVGISIAHQGVGASALLIGNTLQGNGTGIRGVALKELRLARNDLSDQMPRLLSGDLDQLTPVYLHESAGPDLPDIMVRGVSARPVQALRRDAAETAFEACKQEGAV